ncbi:MULTISPECIES: hypothetical protein [unclassified Streptomyces]|uniref:hypothetical protein n=1 Tax=unclassified Streptomyces TaxID=2593676 RepID=UPI00341F57A1
MSATRRSVLGAALAGPMLAQFMGTASAAAEDKWGTVSDGWVEVRWTEQAQAEMDRLGAVVEAVAPAQLVKDSRGAAIRFPVRSGKGDPSLKRLSNAKGDGALEGGIAVRTPTSNFQITDLQSVLRDEWASGKATVNGFEVGHSKMFRWDVDKSKLSTESVPAGRPLKVRLSEVPLHPTPELLETYSASFGPPAFTPDTVVAYLTAEGVYTPPNH